MAELTPADYIDVVKSVFDFTRDRLAEGKSADWIIMFCTALYGYVISAQPSGKRDLVRARMAWMVEDSLLFMKQALPEAHPSPPSEIVEQVIDTLLKGGKTVDEMRVTLEKLRADSGNGRTSKQA